MGFSSKVYKIFLLIVFTVFIGAIGFKITGGKEWSILDCLYMTVITLSTVGFTEVYPLDAAGRIWTIVVIFLGIGIIAYAITQLTQFLLNFEVFRRHKMYNKIKRLKNHFIVCGYGRMGKVVCEELKKQKLPFVVVESNVEKVEKIERLGYLVVHGDATLDETIEKSKIRDAKGLVTVLSTDSENLFVTMSARTMNKNLFITSRCSQQQTNPKLRRAGANKIVNPYIAGGHRIAELLIEPGVEDYVEISTHKQSVDLMIEEFRLDALKRYDGLKIQESKIREEYNLLIAGIITSDGKVQFNPEPEFTLDNTQTIMLMGPKENLKKFKESYKLRDMR
ncbi:MAG: NAD-binding protein [Candidatus Marinimicrobia bacterium]|nr:NAD-binding protein [Candidatus Neomarinimicrobiota bacterium]